MTFFQSKINILQNTKLTLKNLPKTFKVVPKWRKFAKSGRAVTRFKIQDLPVA